MDYDDDYGQSYEQTYERTYSDKKWQNRKSKKKGGGLSSIVDMIMSIDSFGEDVGFTVGNGSR